ncbi:MepB family protein [Epilithonimonas sp.]|uniref:MepB family protein n=1 Tax=Epilithonimonas sp. TaxID=2894511 RepID=UPI00289F5350|nr:MepB family protein [Epilithonimonas sp.]
MECEEYSGFNFKINQTNFKFRKSKLTAKKVGQFVTFWKRDLDGKTAPFDMNNDFAFYLIAIEENENFGFFVFPKVILENENLISTEQKKGKRGFRIYANRHFLTNKQAEKNKLWQTKYFTDYSDSEDFILNQFRKITKF